MEIKEVYYYTYYKFYRLFDSFKTTRWLMDMKAMVLLGVLELWLLFSIINYYVFFSGNSIKLTFVSPAFLIPFVLIVCIKWMLFVFNDSWKTYFKEIDSWP